MVDDVYQDLVRLVHARAGDGFRTAFRYDATDWSALYIRSDISTPELRETISELIDRGRQHQPIIPAKTYERLGPVTAAVELHEHGILIHLTESDQSGTAVTIDEGLDLDPTELARECRAVLAA